MADEIPGSVSVESSRVEFYRHHLGSDELRSVRRVLDSTFLTTGPRAAEFERRFADYLEVPYAVGVSSCTDALVLTLAALDVGPGDEVITTPMSFVATANAIVLRGATPVFADVDPVTGNLDPEAVKGALSSRTRAVLPVHLYGQLCDMKALRAVVAGRDIAIVEDAAHAVEGRRDGYGPGQLGDAACFSFYATKNLSAGEGGAVATRHGELAERIRRLRLHGLDKEAADRYHDRSYRHWDMVELGYKANLSDIQAALLLPQLDRIEERLRRRQEIASRYEEAFEPLDGLDFPAIDASARSARHLFTLWLPDGRRDHFLHHMGTRDIGVAVNYRPIHLSSYYRGRFGFSSGAFPHAEEIGRRTTSIPMYPLLTDAEVGRVIEAVEEYMAEVPEASG
jgi:dTDP-4-amino-4,6-dideoxygalactose transaminase